MAQLWRPVAATATAAVALGVSAYLTLVHYAGVPLVCSTTGVVSCEKVTTSPQSVIFQIPVAVFGVAYWLVALAVSTPWAWRSTRVCLAVVRAGLATAGIGFVLYLISVELFAVRAICLWCTAVHVLAFIFFLLVVTGWQDTGASGSFDSGTA